MRGQADGVPEGTPKPGEVQGRFLCSPALLWPCSKAQSPGLDPRESLPLSLLNSYCASIKLLLCGGPF